MNDVRTRLRNLRSTERRIAADPAWVRATRETLLMQVRNSLPTTQLGFWARQRELARTLWTSKTSQLVRKPAMAFLSFLVVALGGSIFSVSAAEHSLPGDFFYGLKLVTEQARLALTPATEDKLKLKTEFTERRLNEFQQIASNGTAQDQVVQVAAVLKSDLNTIKQQLTQVPPDKVADAAKLVDQKTNEVITGLQQTKAQLSPQAKAQVTDVQSVAADTGVKAIELMAQPGAASPSDVAQAIEDHTKAVSDATTGALPILSASSTDASTPATSTIIMEVATSTGAVTFQGASTTSVLTSSTLPVLVNQVKDLTTQAFAVQKAQDQLEATASALSDTSSSSTDIDASATGTDMGATSGTVITPSIDAAASSSPNTTTTPPTAPTTASSTPSS
jgi:hypothetical protein